MSFGYVDRAKKEGGAGLLYLPSGVIRKSQSFAYFPPNSDLYFGPGMRIIDPATLSVKSDNIDEERKLFINCPVSFQPHSHNVLCDKIYNPIDYGLVLTDQDGHYINTIIDDKHGFSAIADASFISDDEIAFSGMGPKDQDLKNEATRLRLDPISGWAQYRVKIGQAPRLSMLEIRNHTLAVAPKDISGVFHIAWSSDGKRVVFSDFSTTEPNLHGLFNFEVFLLEDGKVRQLTNLKTFICCLAISSDGSTVAFGSDPTRTKTFDAYILKISSGVATPVELAKRMERTLEFNQ